MIEKRVKPILEGQQSNDQIGFRSSVAVGDVFAVFEKLVFNTANLIVVMMSC